MAGWPPALPVFLSSLQPSPPPTWPPALPPSLSSSPPLSYADALSFPVSRAAATRSSASAPTSLAPPLLTLSSSSARAVGAAWAVESPPLLHGTNARTALRVGMGTAAGADEGVAGGPGPSAAAVCSPVFDTAAAHERIVAL
jgi:hypothetical protein